MKNPPIYKKSFRQRNLKVRQLLLGTDENKLMRSCRLYHLQTRKKKAGQFSLGMETKTRALQCCCREPELLILDRPTRWIRSNRHRGITSDPVFFRNENRAILSHILSENYNYLQIKSGLFQVES